MASQLTLSEAEITEMSCILQSRVITDVVAQVQNMIENTASVTLNFAVTGESGSGKSSFINAFRGVYDEDDPEAAETGVTETTQEVKPYFHPTARNVILWDLPGVGTPSFQPGTYLENVGLLKYDFFIIVSSDRFKECHITLAKHIMQAQKKFYFIRNKVDQDVEANARRRNLKGLSDDDVLALVRADCENNLISGQVQTPQVFLLSCFHPQSYDFPALHMTLLEELSGHKRHSLLLSMPSLSTCLIESKRKALGEGIWKKAMMACLSSVTNAATPEVIVPKLMEILKSYQETFCIDANSLRRLAGITGISFEDLQRGVSSTYGKELSAQTLEGLLSQLVLGQHALVSQLERRVPVLGSVVAGGISFVGSYFLLTSALDSLSKDAERVLKRALCVTCS